MDLTEMTREQLREVARAHHLQGYGKMGAKALRIWLWTRVPDAMIQSGVPKRNPAPVPPPPPKTVLAPPPREKPSFRGFGDVAAINREVARMNELGAQRRKAAVNSLPLP